MRQTLIWMAVAVTLGAAGFAVAKYETSVLRTIEPKTLMVASYRCAYNGDALVDRKDPFTGLRNLKSVTRTGVEEYTIVCVNGAHFFDTLRWVSDRDERDGAISAPEIGSGKPRGTSQSG